MEKQQHLSKKDLLKLKNTIIENREFFKSNENKGNFNFIPEYLCRNPLIIKEYENFYNAVEKTPGGWEFLKNENPPNHLGYTRWRHSILDQIEINVKNVNCYRDITIACHIRNMKEIAINGWGYWVDKQIDYYIDIINKELNSNN